jgi:hypothetical protein
MSGRRRVGLVALSHVSPRLTERSDYILPIIVIHTFRPWGA